MGTKNNLICLKIVMKKNYIQYNQSQFATDPFFLQWRITKDKESCLFWESFIQEHPEKQEQICAAIRIVQTIKVNDYRFTQAESELLLEQIKSSAIRKQRKIRRLLISYSAAAVTAIILSLTLLLPSGERAELQAYSSRLSVPDQNIRLITADQKTIDIDNNSNITYHTRGEIQITDGKQEDMPKKQTQNTPGMNTLIVPYGKKTSLTLSDNTRLWLNAGSTVKFPTQFTAGKREIYAEGEVYLEVAKNTESPFSVRTPYYCVRVLGTKFNISAYENDPFHSIVLAEGSVEVDIDNMPSCRLSPNHKLTITEEHTEVTSVNPADYISWKDGILQFSQEPLQSILKRISRYYGINIKYTPGDNERISGKLVLFDDIQTVLDNIAVITPITYTTENNQIEIIKQP